jgi:hypothetical protein
MFMSSRNQKARKSTFNIVSQHLCQCKHGLTLDSFPAFSYFGMKAEDDTIELTSQYLYIIKLWCKIKSNSKNDITCISFFDRCDNTCACFDYCTHHLRIKRQVIFLSIYQDILAKTVAGVNTALV